MPGPLQRAPKRTTREAIDLPTAGVIPDKKHKDDDAPEEVIIEDSRFNPFEELPLDVSVEEHKVATFYPTAATDDVVDFNLPATDDWTRWDNMVLVAEWQLIGTDNTAIPHDKAFHLVNGFASTYFKTVEAKFNKNTITSNQPDRHYLSYMTYLLWEAEKDKDKNLLQEGYHQDTPFELNATDGDNVGAAWRKGLFEPHGAPQPHDGLTIPDGDISGRPTIRIPMSTFCDPMNNPKFCCPGVEISFRLSTNDHSKYIVEPAAANPHTRLKMINPRIEVDYYRPVEKVNTNLTTRMWNGGIARYPFTSRVLRAIEIPRNQEVVNLFNVFQNQTPNFMVFGLVPTAAREGSYPLNPYNFETHGLREIVIQRGIHDVRERQVFAADSDYAEAVDQLYAALGKQKGHDDCYINRSNFNGGFALFAYSLDKDGEFKTNVRTTDINTGYTPVNIHLKFHNAPATPLTCVVAGFCENKLKFDAGKNPMFEQAWY